MEHFLLLKIEKFICQESNYQRVFRVVPEKITGIVWWQLIFFSLGCCSLINFFSVEVGRDKEIWFYGWLFFWCFLTSSRKFYYWLDFLQKLFCKLWYQRKMHSHRWWVKKVSLCTFKSLRKKRIRMSENQFAVIV